MADSDSLAGAPGRLGWAAYQGAVAAGLALAGPVLLARRRGHHLPTLRGRAGAYGGEAPARRGGLWLHAVSVGEVAVAATLARALPPDQPAVVTTVTPTGQERARAAFGARSAVAYLPFDLGFAVRRFFGRFGPEALVLIEGDYWPLLLREAARRGLPAAVVNGRVGDRSFRRMGRLRRFLRPLFAAAFGPIGRFGVQSAEDARRLAALGVPEEHIRVTGNLKYESPEPPRLPELEARLLALAGSRPLVVAGSTMAGEEGRVVEAFRTAGGGERALLVLAPRHPERFAEAAARAAAAGLRLARRSELGAGGAAAAGAGGGAGAPDVLLLDSLGELASLYRLAGAAFVGGTLVATGGHNPLEAARWGVPVAAGGSMDNFREIAADFDRRGAWARVADAGELGATWRRWLDDPEEARRIGARGKRLVEENRGALERTVEMLRPMLEGIEG